MHLTDGFDRTFQYLRLSVTDACNFRCSYCLPEGFKKCGSPPPLSRDELRRAARAFVSLGLRKIRLTGGEPTIRPDFDDIVADISTVGGLKKLALTTNGYRLHERVERWHGLGLNAINVSLDSLNREAFRRITGHDRCHEVLHGIHRALEAGFSDVKINVVYMKDINDHEVADFITLTKTLPVSIRFIELMETGDHAAFFRNHHISTDVIADRLKILGWAPTIKAADSGPANEFMHTNHAGRIGLIAPYSKDFCKSCNRLRFSSQGNLHLCLFGNFGIPLRDYLQSDEQFEELRERLISAVRSKDANHQLAFGNAGMTRNLSAIGG
ncbi:GTP 3',8-cyclase MoaA [Kordiimonas sp.]|uniref:GTP 3',8-cyclase MoaA n=1 Tax=Kordiimonas sp. TaxID=1970157 RepID=UPI003A8D7A04